MTSDPGFIEEVGGGFPGLNTCLDKRCYLLTFSNGETRVQPWLKLIRGQIQATQYEKRGFVERIRRAVPIDEAGGVKAAHAVAQPVAYGY